MQRKELFIVEPGIEGGFAVRLDLKDPADCRVIHVFTAEDWANARAERMNAEAMCADSIYTCLRDAFDVELATLNDPRAYEKAKRVSAGLLRLMYRADYDRAKSIERTYNAKEHLAVLRMP